MAGMEDVEFELRNTLGKDVRRQTLDIRQSQNSFDRSHPRNLRAKCISSFHTKRHKDSLLNCHALREPQCTLCLRG